MLIAWVLISEPEVLFLDEPTTGIDIGGGQTIYSLLQEIKKEKKLTIFMVTHDLNIVSGFSTKVLCLAHKGIRCFGQPKEILNIEMIKSIFGKDIKFYNHDQFYG